MHADEQDFLDGFNSVERKPKVWPPCPHGTVTQGEIDRKNHERWLAYVELAAVCDPMQFVRNIHAR